MEAEAGAKRIGASGGSGVGSPEFSLDPRAVLIMAPRHPYYLQLPILFPSCGQHEAMLKPEFFTIVVLCYFTISRCIEDKATFSFSLMLVGSPDLTHPGVCLPIGTSSKC
jgi:hypothetical protein